MILWSHAAGEIQEMVWVPDVAHGHLGRDPGAESMTRGEFAMEHGDLTMKRMDLCMDSPTRWGPLVIRWFINPINYSYRYHKP